MNINVLLTYKEQAPAEPFVGCGEYLSGRATSRIYIPGDTRNGIVAQTTKPFFTSFYIPVTDSNNTTYWVSKTSLTKRASMNPEIRLAFQAFFPDFDYSLTNTYEIDLDTEELKFHESEEPEEYEQINDSISSTNSNLTTEPAPELLINTIPESNIPLQTSNPSHQSIEDLCNASWAVDTRIQSNDTLDRSVLALKSTDGQYHVYTLLTHTKRGDLVLGAGAQAKVKQARDCSTNELNAVKIYKNKNGNINEKQITDISHEISMLKNVVGIKECLQLHSSYLFDQKKYYVITELCNGDLFDLIDNVKFTNTTKIDKFRIALEIARGVRQIHQCNMIHRDLKPENIFLQNINGELHPKIGDFGFATTLPVAPEIPRGTLGYMSPQKMSHLPKGSPLYADQLSEDAWALGTILYALFTGDDLVNNNQLNECKWNAALIGWTENLLKDKLTDAKLNKLAKQILNKDTPEKSPNILSPTELKNMKSLLRGLLTIDPDARLTAQEAEDRLETLPLTARK